MAEREYARNSWLYNHWEFKRLELIHFLFRELVILLEIVDVFSFKEDCLREFN